MANLLIQFTSYFAFSAVVVLYVYVIQQATSPDETLDDYLDAATRCQSQMSSIAEKGSLSSRYCLVLEELRLEAVTRSTRPPTPPTINQDTSAIDATAETQGVTATPDDIDAAAILMPGYGNGDSMDFYTSPVSSVADIASWIEFESMVSKCAEILDKLDLQVLSRLSQDLAASMHRSISNRQLG